MDGWIWLVLERRDTGCREREKRRGRDGRGLSAVQSTIHLLRKSFACRMPFSCHAQARNVEPSAAKSWDHDRSTCVFVAPFISDPFLVPVVPGRRAERVSAGADLAGNQVSLQLAAL